MIIKVDMTEAALAAAASEAAAAIRLAAGGAEDADGDTMTLKPGTVLSKDPLTVLTLSVSNYIRLMMTLLTQMRRWKLTSACCRLRTKPILKVCLANTSPSYKS